MRGVAMRQYGREDIDYEAWYSDWMKSLAKRLTRAEIEAQLGVASSESRKAAHIHLRAIQRTSSMSSNSMARAHGRNTVAAAGEYKIALSGALEIYDLFPEHTKGGAVAQEADQCDTN